MRVLKHADAWDTLIVTKDTPAIALTATPTLTEQLREFLDNQITTEFKCLLSQQNKPTGKGGKFRKEIPSS